jgi:hypothetical protein
VCGRCGAPCIVAFSGKRQYLELLNADPAQARLPALLRAGAAQARAPVAEAPEGAAAEAEAGEEAAAAARPRKLPPGGRGRGGPKKATTVDLGPQAHLPPGWPLPPATEVWVLTSTSGASALTNEARAAPYRQLAARLAEIPWPRRVAPACVAAAAAAAGSAAGEG